MSKQKRLKECIIIKQSFSLANPKRIPYYKEYKSKECFDVIICDKCGREIHKNKGGSRVHIPPDTDICGICLTGRR